MSRALTTCFDRLLVAAAIAVTLITTGPTISGSQNTRAADPGGPLDVVLVSPSGEVESLTSINVVFSKQMVELGDRHRKTKRAPLTLDPPIEGSFSWIAGRALTFTPKTDLPPGTRLLCRVEAGTKSLDGQTLANDRAWEIVVGEPRLVRSVPEDQGRFPPDGTIHLLFNLPLDEDAQSAIGLIGPAGEIDLERVTPDSLAVKWLLSKKPSADDLKKILALRPGSPLSSDTEYSIRINPAVTFASTSVGLSDVTIVSFRTFGPPRIESARADADGIEIVLESPVDPDDLLSSLVITPLVLNGRMRTEGGTQFRIEGDLKPGRFYVIQLHPGLKSIHGVALSSSDRAMVETPHRPPSLAIVPSEGSIPWTRDTVLRIEATNVDTVSIVSAWVPPEEVPDLLTSDRRTTQLLPRARWFRPGEIPDSSHVFEIPMKKFGKPPKGARILHVQARARSLFAEGGLFEDQIVEALLQFTNLGLSSFIGVDESIAWLVNLASGEAEKNSKVRLHLPHADEPVWSGKTSEDGIIRMPGIGGLPIVASTDLIVEASAGSDAAWLAVPIDDLSDRSAITPHRAHITTDRAYYSAGETVNAAVFVRILGPVGIEAVDLDTVRFIAGSDTEFAQGEIELAHPGNGAFSFTIPESAEAGSYELSLHLESDDSDGFASTTFGVVESRPARGAGRAPVAADDQLDSTPEHERYSPGDTAKVRLPGSDLWDYGFALVLDDGIRSVFSLPNQGSESFVPLPLSGFNPPGIHVHALLFGGYSGQSGDDAMPTRPYLGHGKTYLEISPDKWNLDVDVVGDHETYESGDNVLIDITVLDDSGNPAPGTVTIAVVEEAMLPGAAESDPLRTFFAPRGEGVVHGDTRSGLLPPQSEVKDVDSPDGSIHRAIAHDRSNPAVYWEPLATLGPDGKATIRFKLQNASGRYRVCVTAASGDDLFGYGETSFNVPRGLELACSVPGFVREGDKIDVVATVVNNSDEKTKVQLVAEVDGARINGKETVSLKIKPGEKSSTRFQVVEPEGDKIVLRLRASAEGHVDDFEATIPVDRPVVWDRSFISGRVDPVARTAVDIPAGSLPSLGGLTAVISPSMLGGLEDALSTVIDDPDECLECLASALLGLTARDGIEQHLGSFDESSEAEPALRAREIVGLIHRCAEGDQVTAWPAVGASEASDFVVSYALYALVQAYPEYPIPRTLLNRFSDEVDARLLKLRKDRSGDEQRRRFIKTGPWLLWAISEADRLSSPESYRLRMRDFSALFNMRTEAPLESRVLIGLTLDNLIRRPNTAEYRQGWSSMKSLLMQEIKTDGLQRIGRFAKLSGTGDARGGVLGNEVSSTALFLRFLVGFDSGDENIPGIIAWLLGERRGVSGAWVNNRTTALALDMLASTVVHLEGPTSPVSGTMAIGGNFEDYSFGTRISPINRKSLPMDHLIGTDGLGAAYPFRIESDGRRMIYFTYTLDFARPALDLEPRDQGLLLERSYVDTHGDRLSDGVPLDEPVFVVLDVVVPRSAKILVIEDALPAGISLLNPRMRKFSEGPRIVYSEVYDTKVRLYIEDVPAGIHRIRYPVIASTPGEFRVPGARAELLHDPGTYAIGSTQTVLVTDRR